MRMQFSIKRVVSFCLFDWLGTLAVLFFSARLRVEIGDLPESLLAILQNLQIPVIGWWEGLGPEDIVVLPAFVLVSIIWPFFFIIFSVYEGRRNTTLKDELINVFMAINASTLVLAGVLFLTYRETSRGVFIIFLLLDLGLLLGARLVGYAYHHFQPDDKNGNCSYVIIFDAGELGQRAAIELLASNRRDIKVVGFLDDDPNMVDQIVAGLPVLGSLSQIPKIVAAHQIHDAVVALPLSAREHLIDICKTLQDHSVRVHVIPDFFDFMFPSARYENFGGLPIIDLGDPNFLDHWQIVKRVFDVVAVLIGLAILSPVFLLIAILIRIDSPGAVFYSQTRIGYGGKPFKMIKFRSMRENTEQLLRKLIREDPSHLKEWNEYQKLTNDPRITCVGKVLRNLSIDELPQLWNVVRGEMSLIGPRPFLPSQIDLYGKDAYKNYVRVRPGITGMWQVSGRNKTSFADRAEWDNYYIQNWSFILDIKILMRTIAIVLLREGAY